MSKKPVALICYYSTSAGNAITVMRRGGRHRLFQPAGTIAAATSTNPNLLGKQIIDLLGISMTGEWQKHSLIPGARHRTPEEYFEFASYENFLKHSPTATTVDLAGEIVNYHPTERTRYGFSADVELATKGQSVPLSAPPNLHAQTLLKVSESSH